MTPYVGDGDYCTLDRDGDTYPEVVPQAICEGNNDISYCQLDLCPNVPNNPASNSTPCQGFDTASGRYIHKCNIHLAKYICLSKACCYA